MIGGYACKHCSRLAAVSGYEMAVRRQKAQEDGEGTAESLESIQNRSYT